MVGPMDEKRLPAPQARSDERADTADSVAPGALVASDDTSDASGGASEATSGISSVETSSPKLIQVSHELLFADPLPECDVCGAPVPEDADDEHAFAGHGLYVWSRGGQTFYEEPPLCAVCGIAIGMSALARWEIEEEEG
jgi:hypothetical protein